MAAAALGLAAVGIGTANLVRRPVPVLQCDRETPQSWVHLGALRWAVMNGASLGCGAFTRIGFWSWYLVPVGAVLIGRIDAGVVLWGTYALSRGLGAWGFIVAGGIVRRRGVPFEHVALWALMRQPLAQQVAALQMLCIGLLTTLVVGL